jgi:hypothetical protein
MKKPSRKKKPARARRHAVIKRGTMKKPIRKKKAVQARRPVVIKRAEKPLPKEAPMHQPPHLANITDDIALEYQRYRVGAGLPWDHERHAVRANWAKLSSDIGPRECGRGIRSGF